MIFNFGTGEKILVVAEIGNNHEGSFDVALQMIETAASTGVDAVKFQTFVPEYYVSSIECSRLERLTKFMLTHEQYKVLAEKAKKHDLIFFSTPFDIQSAIFLNKIQPVFKISSGDNNFYPLIKKIASFDKPTIISTGLSDLATVECAVKIWEQAGGNLSKLALMHCVSCYPTPNDQANLGAIWSLKENFPNITIGYSDHTLGITASVLAVAAGAKIIEKHFTLNKKQSDFRDHQLSADPDEMRLLVSQVREASTYIGSGKKVLQVCELDMESVMRRSIAAARNILPGEILSMTDLIWVRPGNGIPVGNEAEVLGKSVLNELKLGDLIYKENLT
jgi:sialic acid synthase SpsE